MAKYLYGYHEERGFADLYVTDRDGKTVWEAHYPSFYESNGEMMEETTIFEDGFMKDASDIEGLENYLKSISVINKGDELVDVDSDYDDDADDSGWDYSYEKAFDDEYAAGGTINPQLNSQVIKRAENIYKNEKGSSKQDFDKAYDKAIIEFGYQPNYFKKVMSEIGREDYDDEYAAGGTIEAKIKKRLKNAFELPIQIAVYVPSTRDKDIIITKREMEARVDEVERFLANAFGGFSAVKVEGGFESSDKGLIQEDAVRVVAFASKENEFGIPFEQSFESLMYQVKNWCSKWSQQSIGVEFENDLFYVDSETKFAQGGKTYEYETYHDTLASALNEADKYVESKGLKFTDETYFPDVTMGGISYGQTARLTRGIQREGKKKEDVLIVVIYRMDNGKYELTMYTSYKKGGTTEDVQLNDIVWFREEKGNFIVEKNTVYAWLYDDPKASEKLESGEYDYVLFPPSGGLGLAWQKGYVAPLQRIWTKKYQNKTKGSDRLIGIVQGWYDEENKKLYIDMMTTRKDMRRKGVNSHIIRQLRKELGLEREQVEFVNTTQEGEKFAKSSKYEHGGYMAKGGEVRFVDKFSYKDGIEILTEKLEDGRVFYKAQVVMYPLYKTISPNEDKDFVIQRAKKVQSDMALNIGLRMEDGGSIAEGNAQMLRSNAKAIKHHAEELDNELDGNPEVEAWVVAKGERAATDLSDITHYLDGRKFYLGGMTAGRWYKDNSGEEFKFIGKNDDTGELIFSDGSKRVNKTLDDFGGRPKENKLFGFFEDGGDLEDGVDLFEDYENMPVKVLKVLGKYDLESGDYRELEKALKDLNSIGYTFEYELDGEPYDLRKIGQKGKSEFYAKGGSIKSIEKRVAEVNELIKRGNDLGIEVVDESTTWQAPMKYKPLKYTNGVLYVEYQELDLYRHNKGMGSDWETKKYKVTKYENAYGFEGEAGSMQRQVLTDIARMYRKPLKSYDTYGYFEDGGEVNKVNPEEIKVKIEQILDKVVPSFYKGVSIHKNIFDTGNNIRIFIAASDYKINGVSGQLPQVVSLSLDLSDMDLHPQVFGGNGGQRVEREPNMNDPKEKYLAMKSVKVPFRTPQPNEKAVLDAIKRFAENYKKTLADNREVLLYQDVVDYDKLLAGSQYADGGEVEWEVDYLGSKLKHKGKVLEDKGDYYLVQVENDSMLYDGAKGTTHVYKNLVTKKMADGGEVMKHKHLEHVTIELLEPTSKGWKVKQIETHSIGGRKLSTPKEKVAYFSKEEIKDLFEPTMAKGGAVDFWGDIDVYARQQYEPRGIYSDKEKEVSAFKYGFIWGKSQKKYDRDLAENEGIKKYKPVGFRNVDRKQAVAFWEGARFAHSEQGKKMAKGGTFAAGVKAIEKKLLGTKVKPKYQKEYGKTYDKAEAHEAASKIKGKIRAMELAKKYKKKKLAKGGTIQDEYDKLRKIEYDARNSYYRAKDLDKWYNTVGNNYILKWEKQVAKLKKLDGFEPNYDFGDVIA